jgi:hypothetical protein
MTDGDLPEGTGKKGGFQAAQGRAPLCIATRKTAAMLADRQRGDSAPDEARVKADSLTPAFP